MTFLMQNADDFIVQIRNLKSPVYLDQDIENWLAEKAKAKGVNLQFLVNELLRKDISLIKKVTG